MPGRGRLSARRRLEPRAPVEGGEASRSVSGEIAVLVNTLRELAAIRATAEDAAARILDSAENLLAFADKEEAILAIMTACGFHDLVGQRVTKIAESLDRVIATHLQGGGGGAKRTPAKRKRPPLEGPGLPGSSEQDQARIDALFRDN